MLKTLIVEDILETRLWLEKLVLKAFPDADVSSAGSLKGAIEFAENNQLGLALIDLNLPDGNGIELVSCLREHSPDTYTVIMTIFDDPDHLFPAIRAGANGYLLKGQSEEDLMQCLKGILTGNPPLAPGIARKMLDYFRQDQLYGERSPREQKIKLTPREEEVLILVSRGYSRKEIAEQLGLAINTIARYIKDLYRKLNVNSRAEAAIIACQMGLIDTGT